MSVGETTSDSFPDFLFQSFGSTTASYNGHSFSSTDAPVCRDSVQNKVQKVFVETTIDPVTQFPRSPYPRHFLPFIDPEAKIPPHTSWNARERSKSFETAGEKLSRGRIGGINGIGNRFEDAESHANRLSEASGKLSVEWVYNCSHSLLFDICEAVFLNYHSISNPANFLKENWMRFHEEHRDDLDAKYLQLCHSQGAIHVKNALLESAKEIQNRVIVVAISPAAIIPKSLCFDSFNYASNRDVIPLGEIAADAILNPLKGLKDLNDLKELTLIDPDPKAAAFDHSFNSPTFEFVINKHIDDYIKHYGSKQ